MSILRDLALTYNLETSLVTGNEKVAVYDTDQNITVIYANLTYQDDTGILCYIKKVDAENHNLKLNIKNSSGEKLSLSSEIDANEEDALFVFKLPKTFTSVTGSCRCRFIDTFVEDSIEKIATSDIFTYTVKENDVENNNGSGSGGGTTGTTSVTYDADNELLVFDTVKTNNEITS